MKIFVGNLTPQVTEADLRTLFEPHGEISKVEIVKDRYTGDSRGFGFIEMPSEGQAKAAIEKLNGARLQERKLTVNEAKPKERSGPAEGGRGGGRGRW